MSQYYCEDLIRELNQVWEENQALPAFRYFTDLMFHWYQALTQEDPGKRIVVLGTGIPKELICAAGIRPFWILGGSHDACMLSDHQVPRDTDPVSRSVLGYLSFLENGDPKDTLILLPVGNDSMRKIAYGLIRQGKNVCAVDVPPIRMEQAAAEKWARQLFQMTAAVEMHTERKVTPFSLRRSIRDEIREREAIAQFLQVTRNNSGILSPSGVILVQNSRFYSVNSADWAKQLHQLNHEILQMNKSSTDTEESPPRVLLAGSPVYFPNMKIPRLLQDAGLEIDSCLDASTACNDLPPKIRGIGNSTETIIRRIARRQYEDDASSFYTKNLRIRSLIAEAASSGQVDGVVWHVLKGQIEPDFELEPAEEFLQNLSIPVFRLETDYQFQDVEQLRIRMEAFSEMLMQKKKTNQRERKEWMA